MLTTAERTIRHLFDISAERHRRERARHDDDDDADF